MDLAQFQYYCLSKKGAKEEFPFDDTTLVYKVGGKIFALAGINPFFRINVKCEPEKAHALRAHYPGVQPGFHMSKKHWNSLYLREGIPTHLIKEWIDHSYEEVIKKLSQKEQKRLEEEAIFFP